MNYLTVVTQPGSRGQVRSFWLRAEDADSCVSLTLYLKATRGYVRNRFTRHQRKASLLQFAPSALRVGCQPQPARMTRDSTGKWQAGWRGGGRWRDAGKQQRMVSSSLQAALTKYHRLGAHAQQKFISHSSGGGMSEVRIPAGLGSEGPLWAPDGHLLTV